jgi:type IV pilus assembly protein PilN
MTRINLLINKLIERRKKKRFIISIISIILIVILTTLTLFLIRWREYQNLQKELNLVEEELLEIEEVISKIEVLKKEKELMKKRIDIIKELMKNQMIWAQVLGEINKSIPEGLWLRNLTIREGGKLELKGSSLGNYPIANLMVNLNKSYLFKDVNLISIEKIIKAERKIQNFHLLFRLEG